MYKNNKVRKRKTYIHKEKNAQTDKVSYRADVWRQKKITKPLLLIYIYIFCSLIDRPMDKRCI